MSTGRGNFSFVYEFISSDLLRVKLLEDRKLLRVEVLT